MFAYYPLQRVDALESRGYGLIQKPKEASADLTIHLIRQETDFIFNLTFGASISIFEACIFIVHKK